MKIGDLATRTGLAVSAIRYYEALGLIAPARTPKGTRRYGEAEARRLAAVAALTALAVPLARIKALLAAPETSATGDEAAHKRIFQSRVIRRDLAETIARAQALSDALEAAEAEAMGCFRCKERPRRETCAACATGAMADEPVGGLDQ